MWRRDAACENGEGGGERQQANSTAIGQQAYAKFRAHRLSRQLTRQQAAKLSALVAAADAALYKAKDSGRNQVALA